MTTVSAASRSHRRAGLEIVLLKQTLVLPWSQFLYAEGGDDQFRLVFSTHDIVVSGNRLGPLLAEVSAQRVSRLREPTLTDKFTHEAGPQISGILVRNLE
jgi:hypothetical protein